VDSPSCEFKCICSILCHYISDFTGFDSTTYDGMILYYHLMAKWSGLGDSTVFSRAGLWHADRLPERRRRLRPRTLPLLPPARRTCGPLVCISPPARPYPGLARAPRASDRAGAAPYRPGRRNTHVPDECHLRKSSLFFIKLFSYCNLII
jgi:hypothetical protein